MREYGIPPPGYRLPDDIRLGRVKLQVSDLPKSSAYYEQLLGPQFNRIVDLHHETGTKAPQRGGLFGLYHFAILLPSREALGTLVKFLVLAGAQFGAADHFVSEAVYLWDPDGLGIEVYADRPRDQWQTNGRELVMTTERLDLRALVAVADSETWTGMPEGTKLGHMHLSVRSLEEARDFYHRGLGLDTVVWSYPGALFMSAGGYHHHLGTNTWAAGARLPNPNDARLLEWELVMPNASDLAAAEDSLRAAGYDAREGVTRDPWGTALRLTVGSSA